jgi:hypothetical protein
VTGYGTTGLFWCMRRLPKEWMNRFNSKSGMTVSLAPCVCQSFRHARRPHGQDEFLRRRRSAASTKGRSIILPLTKVTALPRSAASSAAATICLASAKSSLACTRREGRQCCSVDGCEMFYAERQSGRLINVFPDYRSPEGIGNGADKIRRRSSTVWQV